MIHTDPLPELDAMRAVAQALQPLDDSSRSRVLRWASEKLLLHVSSLEHSSRTVATAPKPVPTVGGQPAPIAPDNPSWLVSYAGIADLYHACGPASDGEKALVVSAWLQTKNELEGLDSFRVNSELKNLGYGIGNITRAFDYLIHEKPALMIQVRKSGTSKQSRKTFRVTDAGIKRIRDMIAQNGATEA
jgi:hypothetical protein